MSAPARGHGPFRPGARTVAQDWDRLARWLAAGGRSLDRGCEPRQFRGGRANLNYLLSVDGAKVVLRRPPAGPVAKGAYDMAREWRVLRRLADVYPLAPRGLLFCDDPAVLGAPFQLMEYRPGIAVGGRLAGQLAGRAGVGERLTAGLVRSMAQLHAVDPAAAGLTDLGRPEGFLARQVEGWARRADAAYLGEPPSEVGAVVAWLRRRVPPGPERGSLLHCDLKLDNMLIDPATAAPVAVVDWEMATRGGPLFDLAVLLSYWVDAGDPAAWQQLFRLHVRGALPDPGYGEFTGTAGAVPAWTAGTLAGPPL